MKKPMKKQITPREHGIPRVEYTIDLETRFRIGVGIPIDNIILSLLFDKDYSNIMVCTSFNIDTT
jgi:hypothetical protein